MVNKPVFTNGLDATVHFPVRCPHCTQHNMKSIRELLSVEETVCSYCGCTIRLDDEKWRAQFEQFAQVVYEGFVAGSKDPGSRRLG
jgi:hypothetical protein